MTDRQLRVFKLISIPRKFGFESGKIFPTSDCWGIKDLRVLNKCRAKDSGTWIDISTSVNFHNKPLRLAIFSQGLVVSIDALTNPLIIFSTIILDNYHYH